jgi:hypothetical protein
MRSFSNWFLEMIALSNPVTQNAPEVSMKIEGGVFAGRVSMSWGGATRRDPTLQASNERLRTGLIAEPGGLQARACSAKRLTVKVE